MVDFQWDAANKGHVIDQYPLRVNTVEEVESLFADPNFRPAPDRVDSWGEQQYSGVGLSSKKRLLLLLFHSEMVKFVLSVVGPLAGKTEIDMLKSPKNPNRRATPKMVAVIKNGHTDAELDEMAERWVNHQGPYLSLAEVLAIETAKQQTKPENESEQS